MGNQRNTYFSPKIFFFTAIFVILYKFQPIDGIFRECWICKMLPYPKMTSRHVLRDQYQILMSWSRLLFKR